jgi:glyoxylase-like metal-dependent hydrolase (beta-lactamase superfamily II)
MQITRILLTHADYDHVGAVLPLREESRAEVLASQVAAEALSSGHSSRQVHAGLLTPLFSWFEGLDGSMKFEVDTILSEGDTLPLLGGLEVLETPGHTPGHLSFYAPRHKLLFAGDSVSTQPDKVLYNRVPIFNWNQDQMIASVHRQHDIRPEIVCSGHGPVIFGAAEKFVEIG